MENTKTIITFSHIYDLPEREHPFILSWLDHLKIPYSKTNSTVDIQELETLFFKLTGFKFLISNQEKVSFNEYIEALAQKKIPFSTFWDHDLLLHVIPTIILGFNFTKIFENISKVSDPISKVYAFETSLLIAYDMLTSSGKNFDNCIEELSIFAISKIRNYHIKNQLSLIDQEFIEIQKYLNQALVELKKQEKNN